MRAAWFNRIVVYSWPYKEHVNAKPVSILWMTLSYFLLHLMWVLFCFQAESMLFWTAAFCSDVRLLLKTDDDSFLIPKRVASWLNNFDINDKWPVRSIIGRFIHNNYRFIRVGRRPSRNVHNAQIWFTKYIPYKCPVYEQLHICRVMFWFRPPTTYKHIFLFTNNMLLTAPIFHQPSFSLTPRTPCSLSILPTGSKSHRDKSTLIV